MTEKTGYPHIDKPWLKYYSEEAINAPLPECTMHQYIWENNREHLSDVALRYYGSKMTYGKLFENIQQAARAFYAMGVRAGDIVTIMSMHTPEMIYSFYALNYLGAVANMVYMTLSEKEIVETLDNTDSKLFFVLEPALERVEAVRDKISAPIVVLGVADSMPPHMKLGYALKARPKKHGFMQWRDFLARGEGRATPPLSAGHTAPAVIVYTSGTTGEPKGVLLSNENLNTVVFQLKHSGKGYQRHETTLLLLPPFFGFGIAMLHLAICTGIVGTLCIDLSVENIVREFSRTKPNRIAYGASLVEPVLKNINGNMSYLYEFTGGGSAITADKEEELNILLAQRKSKAKYTAGYGMTELASVVCLQMNHIYKFQSVGIPLPRATVKIVDANTGKELKYGEVGEMCFSAPNAMIGYFKNPQATDEVIEIDQVGTRWIHTGDLGYCTSEGFVFFKGKIKRIYTVRELDGTLYKIFPQRIEECLESHPAVEICGVAVRKNPDHLHSSIVFVKLKPDANMTRKQAVDEIAQLAQRELPRHMWPESIHVLDIMPMTSSGKIDYRALEQMAE